MLTEDENIVSISFAIQYDIKDASDYIFNLREPEVTVSSLEKALLEKLWDKILWISLLLKVEQK